MIDISENNLKIVLGILQQFVPHCEVRVFGSRYKWSAKKYSDLDLIIVGKEKIYWEIISDIKEAFQESDLTFRVDIMDWNDIEESFKEDILKSGYEVIFPIKKDLEKEIEYITV